MAEYLFALRPQPAVPVVGSEKLFPVHRIFCVGRNYEDHAKEMGAEVDRQAPFYFLKPASAIVVSPAAIPYPPGTVNFHYEMEFVVAIGAAAFKISREAALATVFGYAAGLDMTRRDLQLAAREKGRPWDTSKAFEKSAIISAILPAAKFGAIGTQAITLDLDGARKQSARLSDLVWSVPEVIAHLSTLYHLEPGDLIYTGTPAGVGPVVAGSRIAGRIEGLPEISLAIGEAEDA